MSAIRERISEDIKTAMKAKNAERLSTLRMLKAEILKKETASGAEAMTEEGLIQLLLAMKKQRLDSVAAFEKGGRQEMADKEREEIAVLEEYLPKQMTDDELKALVAATATELGVSDNKAMGALIKAVVAKVAGAAEGRRVSEAVKAHFTQA